MSQEKILPVAVLKADRCVLMITVQFKFRFWSLNDSVAFFFLFTVVLLISCLMLSYRLEAFSQTWKTELRACLEPVQTTTKIQIIANQLRKMFEWHASDSLVHQHK